MSRKLNGNFPLAYMGVRPTTPPQVVVRNRPPNQSDIAGFTLADEWLYVVEDDPSASVKYTLCSVEQNIAVWVALNGTQGGIVLPDHSVALGTGAEGLNSVGPDALSGFALVSQGSSADPIFGTVVVASGGTGDTTFAPYAPVCGGTTSTTPLQSAVSGFANEGYVLTSTGNSSLPSWQQIEFEEITFDVDTGSAQPDAGVINIVGAGGIETSATGSTVTIDGSSIAAGFNAINVQVFDVPGTFTYTPTDGMSYCIVECVGGGAGGNGSGGAGGGGGYCRKVLSSTDVGSSESVTVGVGGTGGTYPTAGTDGGDTLFGSILVAGGATAAIDSALFNSPGGIATGGDLNIQGSDATYIYVSGGAFGIGGTSGLGFGFGAQVSFGTSIAKNGNLYGGGGSYGLSTPSIVKAGNGASGIIIITEYLE